jgi:phosphatidylserine/phosphatidylglycerophosphate/cardiolipin synthase-like enzyme
VPEIDALRAKYFVQQADADPPTVPVPPTYQDSKITPLIDADIYFRELLKTLEGPSALVGRGTPAQNADDFVLISGWCFDLRAPIYLDGVGGSRELVAVLQERARRGVDVRVLVFINPAIMGYTSAYPGSMLDGYREMFLTSFAVIANLRSEPAMAANCCMNPIGHTFGGTHTKLVVIGNSQRAAAFTGGIDFAFDRHDNDTHTLGTRIINEQPLGWHDVVAKIEGPAVQGAYDLFQQMWTEVLALKTRMIALGSGVILPGIMPNTPPLASRTLSVTPTGSHHAQSLYTAPAAKYAKNKPYPPAKALSFAPNGNFTTRTAWKKAIFAAASYIYIEDWGFWSHEAMGWLRDCLKDPARPDLKIVLLTGKDHPNDPPGNFPLYFAHSVQSALRPGSLTAGQLDRIRVFRRDDVHVHSKTTLIDDEWAIIGSTCFTRRSLYTDIEHSVSFLDGSASANIVRDFRQHLWGLHFGVAPASIQSIQTALGVWWQVPNHPITLPSSFSSMDVTAAAGISFVERYKYGYADPDSRETW